MKLQTTRQHCGVSFAMPVAHFMDLGVSRVPETENINGVDKKGAAGDQ